MTVHAWRIVKAKHAATAFSGDGAKWHGRRWNSPGQAVVYTAGSISLAILEMLVHLQREELLNRYVLFEVQFDARLMTAIEPKTLPRTWRNYPPPAAIQQIGDAWHAQRSYAFPAWSSRMSPTICSTPPTVTSTRSSSARNKP